MSLATVDTRGHQAFSFGSNTLNNFSWASIWKLPGHANETSYRNAVGFCMCRYIDYLSICFIGLLINTPIMICISIHTTIHRVRRQRQIPTMRWKRISYKLYRFWWASHNKHIILYILIHLQLLAWVLSQYLHKYFKPVDFLSRDPCPRAKFYFLEFFFARCLIVFLESNLWPKIGVTFSEN